VAFGKVASPGAFAVPYAATTSPTFPSFPTDSQLAGPLGDEAFVYDSSISVELANGNPFPLTLPVNVSEWMYGSYVETVHPPPVNGTYANYTQVVPVQLFTWWAPSSSVTALPSSTGTTSIVLPNVSAETHLEVRVGNASWQLFVLTPAPDLASGIYNAAGVWGFGLLECGVTFFAAYASLWVGKRVARRVHRVPKVPLWWPVAWVGIPIAAFVLDYVPANQALGFASPLVVPVPIAIAAFPYGLRLWHDFTWGEFEGVEQRNTETATNAKVVIPVVTTKRGLRAAPETWREALWALWGFELPAIQGETIDLLGRPIEIQPRGMAVSCPLGSYYESEVGLAFWFDTRKPLKRTRTHLEWTREISVDRELPQPDGTVRTESTRRRKFSPHVVVGSFTGSFPPKEKVAMQLARIRSAEVEAADNEVDRLKVAELTATIKREARAKADSTLSTFQEALRAAEEPRTIEEARKIAEDARKHREQKPVGPTS
jgi:hypothetical protein